MMLYTCIVQLSNEEGDIHIMVHHDMPCDPNLELYTIPIFSAVPIQLQESAQVSILWKVYRLGSKHLPVRLVWIQGIVYAWMHTCICISDSTLLVAMQSIICGITWAKLKIYDHGY